MLHLKQTYYEYSKLWYLTHFSIYEISNFPNANFNGKLSIKIEGKLFDQIKVFVSALYT